MEQPTPDSVTFWLQQWQAGSDEALERVTQLVYRDLRRLAQKFLVDEDPGHTLQATALVHEFYLRLGSVQEMDWKGRGQFISVAARMMRRILIDHARKRRAAKRGAAPADGFAAGTAPSDPDVLDVDRALTKLAEEFPRHAQVVELRFFGGLDAPEIARIMDLSLRTVERDWQFSKAWLQNELSGF
ncbi:MAG TPA: sigma-70 family RNA polymerase sigma factor [Candidatus Solibacter sp.]|nr:sigma-70 family RNA polymerase sigma factor [Candidatus Solibacter sp.]